MFPTTCTLYDPPDPRPLPRSDRSPASHRSIRWRQPSGGRNEPRHLQTASAVFLFHRPSPRLTKYTRFPIRKFCQERLSLNDEIRAISLSRSEALQIKTPGISGLPISNKFGTTCVCEITVRPRLKVPAPQIPLLSHARSRSIPHPASSRDGRRGRLLGMENR